MFSLSSARDLAPSFETLSPPVQIDKLAYRGQDFFVVRDDLLPGGTKQRACAPFLSGLATHGYEQICYASPFAGFAQVALAYTCSRLGLASRIFCEADRTQSEGLMVKHEFTRLAESFGASVHLTRTLQESEELAADLAVSQARTVKIPLGFDCEGFKSALEEELVLQWDIIKRRMGRAPRRLWLPVGSGTLASVFKRIVGGETSINCVNVRILEADDTRLRALREDASITMFSAPERFHQQADLLPSIPSNIHYDAKIWQFLARHGESGDLWWNVAR